MKTTKFYILFLSVFAIFTTCTKQSNTENESVFALLDNIYQDGNWTKTIYQDCKWLVLPTDSFMFEAILLEYFDDDSKNNQIYNSIVDELGEPFLTNENYQRHYRYPDYPIFYLPHHREIDDGEQVYWWTDGDMIVRLYTSMGAEEVGLPFGAVISICDKRSGIKTYNEEMVLSDSILYYDYLGQNLINYLPSKLPYIIKIGPFYGQIIITDVSDEERQEYIKHVRQKLGEPYDEVCTGEMNQWPIFKDFEELTGQSHLDCDVWFGDNEWYTLTSSIRLANKAELDTNQNAEPKHLYIIHFNYLQKPSWRRYQALFNSHSQKH